MLYKASTSTNILITEKMVTAAAGPIAIGTRGTVGSLVRWEIEYFRRVELDRGETTSKRLEAKTYVGVSSNTTTFPTGRVKAGSLGSLLSMSWRRKRRSNNSSGSTFLPSMCSAVDVSESKRFGGLSYRSLKADIRH